MNFSSIVGQSSLIQQLQQFVANDKVPHALMFDSKEGRGGLALAIAFANLIQCAKPVDGDSCGQCQNCIKSYQLIHPDIHYAFPVVKADGKKRLESYSNDFLPQWRAQIMDDPYFNLQSWLVAIHAEKSIPNINVKECNEIIKKLSLKSFSGDMKVMIIWLPEYLGKNGNRLLKLIEEPTDDTVIMFISHDNSRILNTILSRCQSIKVPVIEAEVMEIYLDEQYEAEESSISNAVTMANGSLITAREMLIGIDNNLAEEVINWLIRNYEFKIEEIAKWIDNFAREDKEYQKQFFRFIPYILRTIVLSKSLKERKLGYDFSDFEDFGRLAGIISLNKAEQLQKIADRSISEIDRNINAKIMMMTASLQVSKLLRQKEFEGIL